jgi:hypothetical protein
MKPALLVLAGACGVLAACGQSGGSANNQASANVAEPKKPAYCFFKDDEMKGWAASRGKDGNITVKGKAHVKDPRYDAILGAPTIAGSTAQISPTIAPNGGYEAPGDWWDVKAVIPSSATVTTVTVTCGAKTVAQLSVRVKS